MIQGDLAASPVREGRSFSIKVSSVTGTSLDIDVKTSDSVQELKDRIFNSLHIMPEYQRLTFNEKVLEYGILEDYGIGDGSTITLSPVLKAGTASSTKRSLNIDQKSVSELIRNLPQEQLSILLNQKKPVTVTAKIGDHVVVFTLVPSENNEQASQVSSPSSPSSPSPPSTSESHHHHHRSHHHRSSRNTQVCYHNSIIEAIPAPSAEISLVDRVQLIKKRLALVKRTIDMANQGQSGEVECRKRNHHHHPHHHHHHSRRHSGSNRTSRRSHRHSLRRTEAIQQEQQQEQQEQNQQEQNLLVEQEQREEEKQTSSDLKAAEIEQTQVEKEVSMIIEPSTPVSVPPTPEPSNAFSPSPSCDDLTPTLRCSKCSKKLKATKSFTCRCGHIFCIDHRHQNFNLNSEKGHNCTFDFKALGREEISAANPLIQGPKIQHI